MDFIERYVYAVGRSLPKGQREDIKEEIRSLILDKVDERMNVGETEEEAILYVLTEMGDPNKFARQYHFRPTYIIGPTLYETYLFVLKLTLVASAISIIMIHFLNTSTAWTQKIVQMGYEFIHTGIYVFGIVTLIFLLIERMEIQFKISSKDWNPIKLPRAPKNYEVVSHFEMVVELLVTIFVLAFFNRSFAEWMMATSISSFIDMNRFHDYLMFWNATWVISLVIIIIVLLLNKYTIWLRAISVILTFFQVYLLVNMYRDPALFQTELLSEKWLQWFHMTSLSIISVVLLIGMWELWRLIKMYKQEK